MITTIILSVLGVLMIATAVVAVLHKNLKVSIMSAGIVSLMASVVFVLLSAPDVALTEAAIGSAITIFIFFVTLRKISGIIKDSSDEGTQKW